MQGSLLTPKVFISYSWKPVQHRQKVIELAERLVSDGVYVILDQWDLEPGQDKYLFMEKMVQDSTIDKVLCVINKDYVEKANKREGGVGAESMIISQDIYASAEQTKFIPLMFELGSVSGSSLPAFMRSRIYIDMSEQEVADDGYQKLLRALFDRPERPRPVLGKPPSYITSIERIANASTARARAVVQSALSGKGDVKGFVSDYCDAFLDDFEKFRITDADESAADHIDDVVLSKIDGMSDLRNDLLNVLTTVLVYDRPHAIDSVLNFIERWHETLYKLEAGQVGSWSTSVHLDHYRFFYYEAMLYFTAKLIRKEMYDELGTILNSCYMVYDSLNTRTLQNYYDDIDVTIRSLDEFRNDRLQLNRISVTADIVKQRSSIAGVSFDELKSSDALLYYLSELNPVNRDIKWVKWLPRTSAYQVNTVPVLAKMVSKRHFSSIRKIFGVADTAELKAKVQSAIGSGKGVSLGYNYRIAGLAHAFDFDKINTV